MVYARGMVHDQGHQGRVVVARTLEGRKKERERGVGEGKRERDKKSRGKGKRGREGGKEGESEGWGKKRGIQE